MRRLWATHAFFPDLCRLGGPGLTTAATSGYEAQEGAQGEDSGVSLPTLRGRMQCAGAAGQASHEEAGSKPRHPTDTAHPTGTYWPL